MRNLIDLIQQLSENTIITEKSRGLLYRAKGDRFFKGERANPEQALIFDETKYFPGQPGAYDTHEDMIAAYQALEKKIEIFSVNNPSKAMKSFALLQLHDEKTNRPVYFAKFFGQIKPDMTGTWQNKDLPGFQLEKETSLKSSYALKPSDIFPGSARFKNIQSLYGAFKLSEKAAHFVPGFSMLFGPKPQLPSFENSEEYFTAIRDDLGEIIGPVALVQGLNCGTGAEAARRDLVGTNGSWKGSSINFPSEKNFGLVDSYILTPDGVEVGISSKGEKGATASVKNIGDGIDHVRTKGTEEQKKLLVKYANQIKILNDVATASTKDFPLRYGMKKGFIQESTARAILELIDEGAKEIPKGEFDEDTTIELINLTQTKGAKDVTMSNYNVGYHAMASLAELVADDINNDPVFGEACLKFLNSSPVIQLHLKANKTKDGTVTVTGFDSKYPPNFKGTVRLDPSKNYSATMAGGRMNFAYHGKDAGVEEPTQTTKDFGKAAAKIAGGDVATTPKTREVGDVGRGKRK